VRGLKLGEEERNANPVRIQLEVLRFSFKNDENAGFQELSPAVDG
jgi:hypothetical protein